MIPLKIRYVGRSMGVILPKKELDKLGLTVNDTVYVQLSRDAQVPTEAHAAVVDDERDLLEIVADASFAEQEQVWEWLNGLRR